MTTIKFFLQGKEDPRDIYVRLRNGIKTDAKANTKFAINQSDWNKDKQYLKHTRDNELKKIDEGLQKIKLKILTAYNNAVNNEIMDTEWLKSILNPTDNSPIPVTLVEYFDYYIEKQKHELTKRSCQKLNVMKNFIIKFEKSLNKKTLISEINEDFKQKFLEFGLKQKYSQNYLARNFKFIKTICYDAELNGVKLDLRIRKLRIKENPITVTYLTLSELDTIQNLQLKDEMLDNARDWLIISCETAQRISDFLEYKIQDIRYQKNQKGLNIPFLDKVQQKTQTTIMIPLSKKVMDILEKRQGNFPKKMTDQVYNKLIKEVAKEAGLIEMVDGAKQVGKRKVKGKYPKWELVTSHIGRRSYSTNNYGIIPTRLIMTMTGHKTEKSFLKYIGKSETSMSMQLSEYIN